MRKENYVCQTEDDTYKLGQSIGEKLKGGELILFEGGLGAGKTLLTKGILDTLEFDINEVTSPSFTLVNRYEAKFTVYHIDLWRIEENAAFAVGLDEILEDKKAIVIIEWAERLKERTFPKKIIQVKIEGDGEEARKITIKELN